MVRVMAAEVIPIKASCDAGREPRASVVALLRDALARAESGDMQAVCLVEVDRDRRGAYAIVRPAHVSFSDLIAHTARLHADLLKTWESL